jgi:hypothetical protein
MGVLYDVSIGGVVIFCLVLQLAAVPIFLKVRHIARTELNRSPERP